jgi:hypothetical protein
MSCSFPKAKFGLSPLTRERPVRQHHDQREVATKIVAAHSSRNVIYLADRFVHHKAAPKELSSEWKQ